MKLAPNQEKALILGSRDDKPVKGLTHNFYHYPARFSPRFARAAIEAFSKPGDLVLDPFVGGGTTLVESFYAGRISTGFDINSLAVLISRVKTTPLDDIRSIRRLQTWFSLLPQRLNMRGHVERPTDWIAQGYQRNASNRQTWPIRKSLELAVGYLDELETIQEIEFARCVLLRAGQWALHRRTHVPRVQEFREYIASTSDEMILSIRNYTRDIRSFSNSSSLQPRVIQQDICSALDDQMGPPKLVLTSPPYPGVHVLYHRWQINGRRETPLPYWLADQQDGNGASYYTFGGRHKAGQIDYFQNALEAFQSIARLSGRDTIIVQMVGFSQPIEHLRRYLQIMNHAGFEEFTLRNIPDSHDGRLWRSVPNRKWYANRPSTSSTAKEVVLFHRLA